MSQHRQTFEQVLHHLDVAGTEIAETFAFYDLAEPHLQRAFDGQGPEHVVDVGGGRGLTALCWLCLGGVARATIVDQQMPRSHVETLRALRRAFGAPAPEFFLGKLAELPPMEGERVGFVGIHCCGELTDELIDAAIQANSPFAVISCCHPLRDPLLKEAATWLDAEHDHSHLMDLLRLDRARARDYAVTLETIDPSITPMNRVLMGVPRRAKQKKQPKPIHASMAWADMTSVRSRRHHLNRLLRDIGAGGLAHSERMGGESHVNVHVTDDKGDEYVVRIAPDSPRRAAALEALEREQRFYEIASHLDVPAPEVLAVDGRGRQMRDVFMVRRFVPGAAASTVIEQMSMDERAALFRELGELLGRIHSREFDRPGLLAGDGVPDGLSLSSSAQCLEEAVESGVAWLIETALVPSSRADRLQAFIREQRDALTRAHGSAALVHGEFTLDNVIVSNDGNTWRVTAIIDAEHAAAGDPWWDVAVLEQDAREQGVWEPDAFFDGYGERPDVDVQRARRLALMLAEPDRHADALAAWPVEGEP